MDDTKINHQPAAPGLLDTGFHDRRLATLLEDSAARREFERERRRIGEVDRVVNDLDARRIAIGLSKAELARRIGTNPASIRRLFTAEGANPRLNTLVAVARELGVTIQFVPDTADQSVIAAS